LQENEAASVNSISVNLDSLFDRSWTKALVKHLIARNFIEATYRQKEGFLYRLSKEGERVASSLRSEHFARVRYFLSELKSLKSESTSNINKMLNQSFREE
jgi:flagellar motor switch protein FliG